MKHLLSIIIFLSFMSVASAECISGDCSTGFGTYIYDSGAKYVGEWQDDKMYGQGTSTFAHGGKYVGGYKNDEMHGQGTLTYADGTTERGIWKNDELVKAN